jgi:hypothetical protein
LSEDGLSFLFGDLDIPPESVWECAAERITHPPFPLNSRIISDFPGIFAEFRGKRFSVLWRGSRDSFKGKEFHRRCDGHRNTLTVILDTEGNIFGGFTRAKWGSSGAYKADRRLKSFLFTLRNPHNIPAKKFALKAETTFHAIQCSSGHGPDFGHGSDLFVHDRCDANTSSYTNLGFAYTNDTGLDGKKIFANSQYFRVKEIEVFEITD